MCFHSLPKNKAEIDPLTLDSYRVHQTILVEIIEENEQRNCQHDLSEVWGGGQVSPFCGRQRSTRDT